MKKAIICDLDGTLCDVSHRRHFVSDGRKDYDKFNAACVDDPCIDPIRLLINAMSDRWYDIILCSGRGNEWRHETEKWLSDFDISYDKLHMRAEKDYRSDVIVKREMLREIEKDYEILFVVDDRQSVVDMWREEGLTCLQAAPGDFDTKSPKYEPGTLHILVGPSGAGKSTYIGNNWLSWEDASVISSDSLRAQICGNFRDQSKNFQVFNALHAIVKARIEHGLEAVVDATNIRNADRRALRDLVPHGGNIIYHVIDRPLEEKKRYGGWRNEVIINGLTLVEKHDQVFKANLKDILNGDGDSRVTVRDMRND